MSGEIYLIWASQGEYSDRTEWPVLAVDDEAEGQRITERLTELYNSLCAIYAAREDELEEVGDFDGETLYESTDEGREFVALGNGGKPQLRTDPLWGGVTFTCGPIPFRKALPK